MKPTTANLARTSAIVQDLLVAERRRTPPAPKRREADIQRAILALLHARGVLAWKAGSGGFRVKDTSGRERYVKMGHTGVSDIIGVIGLAGSSSRQGSYEAGTFLAIEVKVPGKQATQEQAAFLASVRQAGGIAFVATSCADVARELGWEVGNGA